MAEMTAIEDVEPACPPAPATPELSLIISTRGRRAELSRLFRSLAGQTDERFEAIVVDQNPAGYLDDVLAGAGIALRRVTSPAGLSLGRNVGLSLARGRIVGFPDDDCWYEGGLVGRILGMFDGQDGPDLLLGRTIDASDRESLGHYMKRSGPVDRFNVWRAGNSNSLFVRRDVAVAIGGFDEMLGVGAPTPFHSGEETDFVLRAMKHGARASFRHDLTTRHDQIDEVIGSAQIDRARRYSRGFGRVLRKHRYPLIYVASRVARPLARSLVSIATGSRGLAAYKAVWAVGTLRGYLDRS